MTTDEMRLAIAEHLAMNVVKVPFVPAKIKTDKNTFFTPEAAKVFYSCYGSAGSVRVVPNFPEDLNACHEMEEMLHRDMEIQAKYEAELSLVCYRTKHSGQSIRFALINATARHRCEAFLRCVGKWKE